MGVTVQKASLCLLCISLNLKKKDVCDFLSNLCVCVFLGVLLQQKPITMWEIVSRHGGGFHYCLSTQVDWAPKILKLV